jgi:hypothetical protein
MIPLLMQPAQPGPALASIQRVKRRRGHQGLHRTGIKTQGAKQNADVNSSNSSAKSEKELK